MSYPYYRVQRPNDALERLLDPRRRDGWVASDEGHATQPHGISACDSLEDLRSYISHYSMNVRPGDLLLGLCGKRSREPDRDQYATRVIVTRAVILGDAYRWYHFRKKLAARR